MLGALDSRPESMRIFIKKKQTNKQRTKQNKQSLDKYHSYLILTGMFQKVLEGLSIMFLRKQRR